MTNENPCLMKPYPSFFTLPPGESDAVAAGEGHPASKRDNGDRPDSPSPRQRLDSPGGRVNSRIAKFAIAKRVSPGQQNAPLHNALWVMLLASIGGIVFAHAAAAQNSGNGIEVQECVVQFADEVDVPALESGRVSELHIKTNQSVLAGGPVLRLGDETLVIRRKAAQMRLESAVKEAESTIELDFAKAALEEANAELNLNLRIEKEKGGAITRERVRQLRLSVKRAELEVARAHQRIEQSLVAVKLQQSEVSVLDDQLRRLHADSPLNGIVLDVGKSKGEWVEKGQSVATIARIDRLHVHAFIRGKQISPSDCVGLPVSVFWQDPTTSAERNLRGEVISVDPQRLPGSRFRIHAEVVNQSEQNDKRHWQLNPGADVRMVVHTGSVAKRFGATSKR